MPIVPKKITLELEYTIHTRQDGKELQVVFTHPDLNGSLSLEATSMTLVGIQLAHLELNKGAGNPIDELVTSANKLVDGIRELKTMISKK